MFGNLLGDMEERQKELKKQLAEVKVEGEAGGGAVMVTANANREILNIRFNKEKLDWEDAEMVEDLSIAAINDALAKAAVREQEETQKLVKDMLPPGLGSMGSLFG
jgi:hypothetical protein